MNRAKSEKPEKFRQIEHNEKQIISRKQTLRKVKTKKAQRRLRNHKH